MPYLPQFYHLPIAYSNIESIKEVNHQLGQSPPDIVIPGNGLIDTPRGVLY
jgi:hypothetical protein